MVRVLVALLVAVVVGAVALPGSWVGLGWVICALAALAVAVTARSARGMVPEPPAPPVSAPDPPVAGTPARARVPATLGDRAWRYAAGVAALALTAVPAVRSSGILAFICLAAALLLASYALLGGRTWLAVVAWGFALFPGAVLGVQWLTTHRPRRDGARRGPGPWRVILAFMLTVVLVAILIPLLRSADPVFADLLDRWTGQLPRLDGRSVAGALLLGFISVGAAYYAYHGPAGIRLPRERNRPLGGVEWMLPLVVVDLIFAVFVFVQLNVLFGGDEYVLGAGGPDYADYARGGFGQLCFVTVIALGLAAGLGALARREALRQRVMIRIVGGLLCTLTLVIVVSALKRMLLYVDVYGFTWLRLTSFSFEVFLGVVFVLLLLAGIRLHARWLPRVTMAAATTVLFTLVAVNPDALIARTTIEARLDGPYSVDLSYLNGLSADAMDEILALPASQRGCAVAALRRELATPDPWYRWNVAREHARSVLADGSVLGCTPDGPRTRD